jgi:hypothetical protein
MKTHNELYLPVGITISPQELFCARTPRQTSLYHSIKYRMEAKLPIDPSDLLQAAYFPHIFEALLETRWLTATEIDRALQRPDLRFGVVMQNYESFAEEIGGPLEHDLESIERLLVFFQKTNTPPPKEIGHYSGLLEQDPDRYFRLYPAPADEVRDRILKQTLELCDKAPQHAYFRLKLVPNFAVAPEIVRALQKSDYYSYQAARHLRSASAPDESWRPLLDKLTAPRWIFHCMRDGLLPSTPALLSQLSREPEWAAQWMVEKGASFEEIIEIYEMCMAHSYGHPLFHDISLWIERKRRLLAA